MRINRVANQRQLSITSFNTKVKGWQSQMMNHSVTKWPRGKAIDILKAFLESFVHTKTAEVMQVPTKCTQNPHCTASREATSNSTIAVTARTAFNDQEMHLLRLISWAQSWRRTEDLFSVLLGRRSCRVEGIISVVCMCVCGGWWGGGVGDDLLFCLVFV